MTLVDKEAFDSHKITLQNITAEVNPCNIIIQILRESRRKWCCCYIGAVFLRFNCSCSVQKQ